MKKVFCLIMLLCISVVFTGCISNNNSSNKDEVQTLNIYVAKDIVNQTENASLRASVALDKIKLLFNGVEFPGHSMDSEFYRFSKVMYKTHIIEMTDNTASASIHILYEDNTQPLEIVFSKVSSVEFISDLQVASINGNMSISVDGNGKQILYINNEPQFNANEVGSISMERTASTSAKLIFSNQAGEKLDINFDSCTWKISALNDKLEVLESWTSSDNSSIQNLAIKSIGSKKDGTIYYQVTLTESGESAAKSYNLNNLNVRIDYIYREDGVNNIVQSLSDNERTLFYTTGKNGK